MATEQKKVTFGLGTITQALKKINPAGQDGLLAFGYDAEHGGIIVADGKLVTSRLLDFTYDEETSKLTLFYADKDNPDVIQEQEINLNPDIDEDIKEQLIQDVLDAITEALSNPESEVGQQLVEAIKDAIIGEISEDLTSLKEWAESEDLVTAAENSGVKVEATGETNKKYEISLNIDSNTLKVNEEGKLTAIVEHDVRLGKVEYDSQDGKHDLVFTLHDEEGEEIEGEELRVDVSDLVDIYTSGDSYVNVDNQTNKITLKQDSDLFTKLGALYTFCFGNEGSLDEITSADDYETFIPVIDFLRNLLAQVGALETTINGTDSDGNGLADRFEDLEDAINGEDGIAGKVEDIEGQLDDIEGRISAVENKDCAIYWGALEDSVE